MGQCTQIFLQRKNNKGEIKNEFYHYQWGFGGTMYRALMNLFLDVFDKQGYDTFSNDCEFLKSGKLYGLDDTESFEGIEIIDNLETTDFINQLQQNGDNNNGYLVIQMTEDEIKYATPDFKFGFVDSGSGVKGRYLTWQEYAEKHGCDYTDKMFRQMFESFLKWSEMEELTVKE